MRKKTKNYLKLALILSLSGASAAYCDTLNGGGATWNDWSSSSLVVNQSSPGIGSPYWNNISGDGNSMNIGWCINGGGNCTLANGNPGYEKYFGQAGGAAPLNMYLTSYGNQILSLQGINTNAIGGVNTDIFGYYLTDNTGAPILSTMKPIFTTGVNGVGATFNLSTIGGGTNYGFYIENIQGATTANETDYYFFMDSLANTSDLASAGMGSNGNGNVMPADSNQHLVFFQQANSPSSYYIGTMGADACNPPQYQPGMTPCVPANQFDYQDMVIELTTNAVPEPASLALFGSGLLLTGFLLLRRKRQAKNLA